MIAAVTASSGAAGASGAAIVGTRAAMSRGQPTFRLPRLHRVDNSRSPYFPDRQIGGGGNMEPWPTHDIDGLQY